jgi:hypothetical protein
MRISAVAALIAMVFTCGFANANPQADSFANIYSSICLKHLMNLDALRAKLKDIPELPKEKANLFLQGMDGSAWPVPDKHGVFVVALPTGKNMCSVFAHRVDAQAAEEKFVQLVKDAPAPLVSRLVDSKSGPKTRDGDTRTVSYSWGVPQAKRKMLFTLTTATGESANIQGLATASLGQ